MVILLRESSHYKCPFAERMYFYNHWNNLKDNVLKDFVSHHNSNKYLKEKI